MCFRMVFFDKAILRVRDYYIVKIGQYMLFESLTRDS